LNIENARQILLVDDDPTQLRLREAVLRDAGFQVAIATSAEVAMALLAAPTDPLGVGAIITDHLLPGATGAEFARKVRQSHPKLPIIVLTGLPGAEAEYQGIDVAFLMKPVSPGDLVKTVETALHA
jgi:DNA-binding response OmpR family regulator